MEIDVDDKMILNHQVEVELTRDHLHACWYCLRKCIDEEIPADQADIGFLMEVMGDVAKQDKDTTKKFKLKLNFRKMRSVFYCLRIVAENDLWKTKGQQTMIIQSQSFLAKDLDAVLTSFQSPDEIIESKDRASGLTLVQ